MPERHTPESVEALIEKPSDGSHGCWRWLGSHRPNGRPQLMYQGKGWTAYRLIYTFTVGEIQEGMTLDHTCRNVGCVNPGHLEPVTRAENTRRELAVRYAGRDACPRGHLRSEHGKQTAAGHWRCTECNRIKCRKRYAPKPRRSKTECPAGHSRAEFGVIYGGEMQCKECNRLRARARRKVGQ